MDSDNNPADFWSAQACAALAARLAFYNMPTTHFLADTPPSPAGLHHDLSALRPALLRFALLQLRDDSLAEDVVQDALIAVLEHPDRFAGQSSLRTYVTGIMKYKIIDLLRARRREQRINPEPHDADEPEADIVDAMFRADGHAVDPGRQWGDPEATLRQKDFFRVMEMCLENMPATTARIFMMREWLELDTEEICKELGISTANAWVILYRARLRLRECLELNWFGERESAK